MSPLRDKIYRIKTVGVILLPLILYLIPKEWIFEGHSICLFKNIFGVECIGCGITRAIIAAIHFDFNLALSFNKLVVIVLPLLFYVWLKILIDYISHFVKSKHYSG